MPLAPVPRSHLWPSPESIVRLIDVQRSLNQPHPPSFPDANVQRNAIGVYLGLVKGTAPEKIVPDKTLSNGGGAPEHQSLKPGTAELAQTPVWWESTIEGLWLRRLHEFLGKY